METCKIYMKKTKVEDLREGDRVDLESCPYLKNKRFAKEVYGEVSWIEISGNCVTIYYEGLGYCGYKKGTKLMAEKVNIDSAKDMTDILYDTLFGNKRYPQLREQFVIESEVDSNACEIKFEYLDSRFKMSIEKIG